MNHKAMRALWAGLFVSGWMAAHSPMAHAQRGLQIGLRVNPQITRIMNSGYADSLETPLTFGVAGGASVGYGFNNNMSVVVEAYYSSQGQRFTYNYNNPAGREVEVIRDLRLRYLKFPVFFKWGQNFERKYSFYGMLGPQFEILMSASDENNDTRYQPEYDPYVETANFPREVIDRYRRFNVSAVGVVGLDVKLRYNLYMNVQARADYGFMNILDDEVAFQERRAGTETTLNYWKDHQKLPDPSNTMNVGLTLGFTYVFIPKFHY